MKAGFVNLLKPAGATASDMVVKLRRILQEKKIGHLGTLDPGAVGVLPIAVGGAATKLFDLLTNKRKTYRAFFTFGKTTDTLDSYGELASTSALPSADDVLAAAKCFVGTIDQLPPAYSAISVGGVRAYKLARNGEDVALPTRKVTIYSYDFVRQIGDDTFVFDIECSGGTYIRSLARDLAASLGLVAYMSGLIRLQSGNFCFDDALRVDEVETLGEKSILPLTFPLSDLPDLILDDMYYKPLSNGVKFRYEPHFDGLAKTYCNGEFFGLGEACDGKFHLKYYLKDA